MNIENQTSGYENNTAGIFLEPQMSSLLQMTDVVLMKIKQQSRGLS